jgi:hypothetical protein
MPEENKTVDIDTSGPGVDVELDNQQTENGVSNETTNTDNNESNDSLKKPDEQLDIQVSEAEIAATKDISKLGYEEARLSEIKVRNAKPVETEVKQPVAAPQEMAQPINPDPKAQQWAGKNTWFGQDEAMTYTAFSLHQKLTEEEGYDPQSDEYYEEIDRRIKVDFPHKFGTTNTKPTNTAVQNVASATRSTAKVGRKVVRLTPSQVAIAKKLGVPLQEYAKQLNITKEV